MDSLTGQDDALAPTNLAFAFPFAGISYETVYVSTNGYLALGTSGPSFCCPSMDDLVNSPVPLIAPFFTDLDLTFGGLVHYRTSSNGGVFTWSDVGTWSNPSARFSFQATLMRNGTIRFSYNGIPNLAENLDENVLVGFSSGRGLADPGQIYFQDGGFFVGNTLYRYYLSEVERFDLDGRTYEFVPAEGGYNVAVVVPEPSALLLLATALLLFIAHGAANKAQRWKDIFLITLGLSRSSVPGRL